MAAQTLNCSSCGAGVASDAAKCDYCGVLVATIACPSCFGMLHVGSRYCRHCGELAASWEREPGAQKCPRCAVPLLRGTLGGVVLHECEKCLGVWIAKATFEEVCRNHEHQASVLRTRPTQPATARVGKESVHYVPCPECQQLMNRVNFARCSGVIVDVCRDHGTWFDASELQSIVAFIRSDGLGRSRDLEKHELDSARRRLANTRRGAVPLELPTRRQEQFGNGWLELVLESAAELVAKWWRR